ncbi:MAG: sulfurtransferase complex subunit TusB [Candidatus Thorarchaeota archaeon]|nr:MAG: sulfurtransferase complex subunit TusB [Candidatus Thorarchaeota archaeon]
MKYLIWLSHDTSSIGELCRPLLGEGHEVGILLIQDGVFMLDRGCPLSKELQGIAATIYALKDHIDERGIGSRLVVEAEHIDYNQMVELLMEKYDKIVTA